MKINNYEEFINSLGIEQYLFFLDYQDEKRADTEKLREVIKKFFPDK